MQKVGTDAGGAQTKPGVDQVLKRLREAFHCETDEGWMNRLKVQPETVRTWRKRGFVPPKQLMKAVELAGVPLESFVGFTATPGKDWGSWGGASDAELLVVEEAHATNQTQETKVQLDVHQFFLVPQLSVHASAGNGYAVDAEDVIGRFAFRRDWLSKKVGNTEAARVITARGRSMEPTVRDGDILLVDTSLQERLTDGIYVLDFEGESRCKRLQRLVDGGLRIHSDNAAEFPPEDVPPGRVNQVRVVGKVIWVGGER